MSNFFISLSAILVYFTAAYGWGRLAINSTDNTHRPGWVFTIVFGLGIWVFIGGLLNFANLAVPMSIHILLILGTGFSITFSYIALKKRPITVRLHNIKMHFKINALLYWLPLALICLALVFLLFTQMPAKAFNFHDDFHTYIPRIFRMLQTGSLGGNPFDVFGADSLGAQAFLQSFFVNYFPITYINAFDAIACFILSLLLLWEMGRRLGTHWIWILASILTFISIHPQYVNVSTLYSGSLMILATIFSSIIFADHLNSASNKRALIGAFAIALFMTSLVSLKTTFAIFVLAYFIAYFGCLLYLSEHKPRIIRSILYTTVAGTLLLIPWILLSLPNYLTALHLALDGNEVAVTNGGTGIIRKLGIVFSAQESWGGDFLTYSLLASALAVAWAISLFLAINIQDIRYRQYLAAISAACFSASITYFTNVYLLDPNNGVRYSVPVLIAISALAVLMLAPNKQFPSRTLQHKRKLIAAVTYKEVTILIAAVVASGSIFSGDILNRIQRVYTLQSQLSFPVNQAYLRYNKTVTGELTAASVHELQHKIKAGSPIFVIMATPFHLDFSRNPIYSVNESTFLNPWIDFPLDKHPEVVRKYLTGQGIRYVIYQYKGFGMKRDIGFQNYARSPFRMLQKVGETNINFRKTLRYLARNSHQIYKDGAIVIFDISRNILQPKNR